MNRHGYFPIPTAEPAEQGMGRKQKSLRPGLFFMFGDRGKKYAVDPSDSEIEMTELNEKRRRPKRRKVKSPKEGRKKSPPIYMEEPVLPGDTLQRIALRYDCREADIRRANYLYNNQDFFVLKTVKIPVRKHSILTDPLELERRRKGAAMLEGPHTTTAECSCGGGGARDSGGGARDSGAYVDSSDEEGDSLNPGNGGGDEGDGECGDESGSDSDRHVTDISIRSALKWKHTRTALLTKFDEDLKRLREQVAALHDSSNLSRGENIALTLHPIGAQGSDSSSSMLHKVLNVEAGWKTLSDCDWRLVFFAVTFFFVSVSVIIILFIYKSRH